MSSGVSGLQSQQTAMDVIGNNIANVSTNGFKSSRTTFRDVYYQTLTGASDANGNMGGSNPSQIGYGSQIGSVDVLNTNGGFVSTGLGTDCYIDGEGYFVVKDGAGKEYLTQVGTFGFDGNGNLVDGKNGFVCGYPYAGFMSGKSTVSGATINFGEDNDTALDGYTVKLQYGTTAGVAANSTDKTITITLVGDATADPPVIPTQKDLQDELTAGTWTWTGTPPTNEDGDAIAYTAITVEGVGDAKNPTDAVEVKEGSGSNVVQAANFDYSGEPEKIVNTYGELKSLSIGADGAITGVDASGTVQTIGQIALANVPNPNALSFDGNSYFTVTNNAGTISYDSPGSSNLGKLKTGGLAGSNVDLATEFSNMIVTQRAFQANSKIITVSDEMLDTLVNMKR
jgi:fagellar hook-basal body proteins